MFFEKVQGATRLGATGLRASERQSASERVSEREGFQRFLRGSEDPPTTGTAPGGAITNISPNKRNQNPRNIVAQRLAGSFTSRKVTNKNPTRQTYSIADNIHTDTQMFPHNAQTTIERAVARGSPRGGGWANPPPSLLSKIAAISGVRGGHRNRTSQKSLRFRCRRFLSITALGIGNLIGRAQFLSAPAPDQNQSPSSTILKTITLCSLILP